MPGGESSTSASAAASPEPSPSPARRNDSGAGRWQMKLNIRQVLGMITQAKLIRSEYDKNLAALQRPGVSLQERVQRQEVMDSQTQAQQRIVDLIQPNLPMVHSYLQQHRGRPKRAAKVKPKPPAPEPEQPPETRQLRRRSTRKSEERPTMVYDPSKQQPDDSDAEEDKEEEEDDAPDVDEVDRQYAVLEELERGLRANRRKMGLSTPKVTTPQGKGKKRDMLDRGAMRDFARQEAGVEWDDDVEDAIVAILDDFMADLLVNGCALSRAQGLDVLLKRHLQWVLMRKYAWPENVPQDSQAIHHPPQAHQFSTPSSSSMLERVKAASIRRHARRVKEEEDLKALPGWLQEAATYDD